MASKKADFSTANVTVDHAGEAWSGHSAGSGRRFPDSSGSGTTFNVDDPAQPHRRALVSCRQAGKESSEISYCPGGGAMTWTQTIFRHGADGPEGTHLGNSYGSQSTMVRSKHWAVSNAAAPSQRRETLTPLLSDLAVRATRLRSIRLPGRSKEG